MTRGAWAVILFTVSRTAHAESDGPWLSTPPSIASVRVEPRGDTVLIVHEISLPRGTLRGDASFYVAFGAPGVPLAVDAHLLPLGEGELESNSNEAGIPLPVVRARRRPDAAIPLLGSGAMAGFVVSMGGAAFDRSTERGKMAALRLRSVHAAGRPAEGGRRDAVVRLGMRGGALTLGRIVVVGSKAGEVDHADAAFCGGSAPESRVMLAIERNGSLLPPARDGASPPVLTPRDESADLCVRYWMR